MLYMYIYVWTCIILGKSLLIISDIIARRGLNNVTVDGLVEEITPKGRSNDRSILHSHSHSHSVIFSCSYFYSCSSCFLFLIALVPDYIKKELLQQIRDYIDKTS